MYDHMSPHERMERIAQLLLRAIAIEERDRPSKTDRAESPAGSPNRRAYHRLNEPDSDAGAGGE